MLAILAQTLPFFALIALGYAAARAGLFGPQATAALTRFVFYYALSAMLFRFAARLSLGEVFDWTFVLAYLAGTTAVYLAVSAVALSRRLSLPETAVEAQCGVIGNVGFLGVPMLALLLGEAAIGPIMLVLAIDLIVFSSLIVVLITGSRDGAVSLSALAAAGRGLLANPMIVSITLGLAWASSGWALPRPAESFLELLGGAATPGALFAIGASLATASAERLSVAGWLSLAKLVLHPAAVALAAFWLLPVAAFPAKVMVAAAALPVAGNVYMLAAHYQAAPQRASAAILVSTAFSVLTLPAMLALLPDG